MKVKETNPLQIDQAVFTETSFQKLLKYFPDYKSLLTYHAQRMQEAFPLKSHLEGCDFCKARAAQNNSEFGWLGNYYDTGQTTALLFMGILMQHPKASKPDLQVRFITNHRLCKSCLTMMRRKRVFAELLDNLSILFVLLAVVLIMGGLFICGFALAWKSESVILIRGLTGLVVGGLFLFGFFRYIFKIYSWILPKELRMISKPPFKLVQIK
jgi:hypothetical protein